jgi:tape measure domain-containing protein
MATKKVEAFRLSGRVEVDAKTAKRDLKDLETQTKSTSSSMKGLKTTVGGFMSGVASVAGGNILTNVLGGITGAMSAGVKAGFDYNKLQEQTRIGFEVMLKSGEKAKAFMQELQAYAERSPMDLPGVYENAQQLKAMGFEAKQVIPILTAAGDAAAGLGKVGGAAAQKVDSITRALGQMWSKGKVSAEEMSTQLVEAGVPAWRYLADEIAKTDKAFAKLTDDERLKKVQEMGEKGLLNARAAVRTIVEGMERENEGLGERISKETVGGIESNLADRMARLMGEASGPAFEKYKKVIQGLLDAANSEGAAKVAAGVANMTGAVLDAGEMAIKALSSGNYVGLGLDAIGGYAEGIKQGAVGAVQAGVGVVKQVYNGVASEQQSHSPSLLFARLGRFAAQGYALGFQDELQKQETAILSRVGDTLTKIAERTKVPVESLMQANQKLVQQLAQIDDRLPSTMADIPVGTEIRVPSGGSGKRNKGSRRGGVAVISSKIETFIADAARAHDLDPLLVRAMLSQESGGKVGAISPKGASGLMQLMPATARAMGVKNIFDPRENIFGGAKYMREQMDTFGGNIPFALAAYNAGPGRVHQYGGVPPASFAKGETFNYVRNIMANYGAMQSQQSRGGWMDAGGASRSNPLSTQGGWMDGGDSNVSQRSLDLQGEILQITTERVNLERAYNKSIEDAFQAEKARQEFVNKAPQMGRLPFYRREQGEWDVNLPRPDSTSIWTKAGPEITDAAKHSRLVEGLAEQRDKRLEELDAKIADLQTQLAETKAADIAEEAKARGASVEIPFKFTDVQEWDADKAKQVLSFFDRARDQIAKVGIGVDDLATTIDLRGLKPTELPKLPSGKKAVAGAFDNTPLVADPKHPSDAEKRAWKSVHGIAAATKELKVIGKEAFGQFAQGVGDAVENFVLLGEMGPQAMRKLTAQILASVASQAAVKAIFEVAEGFAALANPVTAWQAPFHFKAAAIYAVVAGGAAIGGRALAGDLFKDKNQVGASNANEQYADASNPANNFTRREHGGRFRAGQKLLVGERRPEVVAFDGPGYVHSSVEAFERSERRKREAVSLRYGAQGGNGISERTLQRLVEVMDRLDGIDEGKLIGQMARKNSKAFVEGVTRGMDSDPNAARNIGRRLGSR